MYKNLLYILTGSIAISLFTWYPTANLSDANYLDLTPEAEISADTTTKKKSGKKPKFQLKDRLGNRFSNKTPHSSFVLKDPKGVSTEFRLDTSGKITVFEKLKDLPDSQGFKPAENISLDEYNQIQNKTTLANYWRNYASSLDGKSESKGRGLLPKIELPKVLDRIFGSDKIDFKPNGSILLDMGAIFQFIDNPATPVELRRTGNFNFNEQMQINFQGKIGDKLNLNTNFDTKASFAFQNQLKLNWRNQEEDILQGIEVGNTEWKLNSQLIPGVQNLFGLKTLLRFGNLDVTLVAAQQQSKQDCITLRGGTQGKGFEIKATDYDENRHFFLSNFFRDNYEKSLRNLPVITSGVQITRLEVYVTNRNNNTETLRNLVALSDLGEPKQNISPEDPSNSRRNLAIGSAKSERFVDNKNNGLYGTLTKDNFLRKGDKVGTNRLSDNYGLTQGRDYDILKGSKKLTDREYRFSPELGYISLITPLRNDEILAVSYEYSLNGQKHQVGELTEDYITRPDNEMVVLKLLKSATIRSNLNHPMWKLMMKNIYSLQTQQINRQGFQLRVIYKDDKTGIDNPNLQEGGPKVKDVPLIRLLGLDKLNPNNDPQPDGNFDFVENVTVDTRNGKIIFPVLEPFGNILEELIPVGVVDSNGVPLREKYVFSELYSKPISDAQQVQTKNKFFLKGSSQGFAGGEISLPFGVDAKSVNVTAGGVALQSGSDYQVDQNTGKVRILNAGVSNSGREIKVCYEKPDLFSNQQRFLLGTRLDYNLGPNARIGATFQRLRETPPAQLRRVQIGNEPVNNTIFGFDGSYQKESRFLTKMIDALPLISTKEISAIDFTGEYAKIIPNVNPNVNGNAFIDDFESARTVFSLSSQPTLWRHATTPKEFVDPLDKKYGYNFRRAKISAYSTDISLYGQGNFQVDAPGVDAANSAAYVYERPVTPKGLYPNRDVANNFNSLPIGVLDVAYFPTERGIYNFNTDLNTDGSLKNPKKNFGAITRAITSDTDFENANVEVMEFWMMNPFEGGERGIVRANGSTADGRALDIDRQSSKKRIETGGKLVFELGDISEDFIPDGNNNFENGIPGGIKDAVGTVTIRANVQKTDWGIAPTRQFVTNAFDNQTDNRSVQDVGLDGLPNTISDATQAEFSEQVFFRDYLEKVRQKVTDAEAYKIFEKDPSGDDFTYYLNEKYNGTPSNIARYKNFMGLENNSPPSTNTSSTNSGFTESNSIQPDREDLNNDNTVNDLEAFYKYELDLKEENMVVGKNYIVDKVEEGGVKWFLFRVPLSSYTDKSANVNNFKSIRFARMVLTDWEAPVVLRFAQLQLSGFQYRTYPFSLRQRGLIELPEPEKNAFKVTTVSVEENGVAGSKTSVPYVIPPGFERDRDFTTINQAQLNEQSLSMCVERLAGGESRAVFKSSSFDFINYKRLKMFVHMDQSNDISGLGRVNNEVSAFIRLGTDLTENYYEIEKDSLSETKIGETLADSVWKQKNEFDVPFDLLKEVKINRNNNIGKKDKDGQVISISTPVEERVTFVLDGVLRSYIIRVIGNPDLSTTVSVMLGVKNSRVEAQPKTFCIWVNELRAFGFDQTSGQAAIAKLGLKLADFANVTMNGAFKTYGFGGVQQKISERARENTYDFGISANVNLDKLLPEKWGIKLPMYVSYDKKNITPHFDPLDPDIEVKKSLEQFKDKAKRDAYEKLIEDNSERTSINFSNVRKVKTGQNPKSHPWDVENLTFTYAFSEALRTNTLIDEYRQISHKGGIGYSYTSNPKPFEPFKKYQWKHPLLRWVKDFNLTLMPNSIVVRADMDRSYVKNQLRNGDPNKPKELTTEGVNPLFEKYWMFNRQYNLGWNLSKSLTVNYSAVVNAIIDEPEGEIREQSQKDSITNNLLRFGRSKNFDQKVTSSWRLPLNKSPLTDWMTADYTHNFGYQYTAASFDIRDENNRPFGNIIKNFRDRGITGKIDFVALYNRIKALRIANSPRVERKNIARTPGDDEEIVKPQNNLIKDITRLLMAVRGIQVNYNINETSTLPGFMPTPGILGMSSSAASAPGFDFITGSQDYGILQRAENNGWLTNSIVQPYPFVQTRSQIFSYRTSVEPFKDFRIQIEGKYNKTDNYQENFRPATLTNNEFKHQSRVRSGNYSMTFLSFLTAFSSNSADESSALFNTFKNNREDIKKRLIEDFGTAEDNYDKNSQDVLIPAFFAAYSGTDPKKVKYSPFYNIPLPNWRIDYGGLANVGWFKKKFSNISITHSYTSTYSVGNFVSSLDYQDYSQLTLQNMLYPLSAEAYRSVGQAPFLATPFLNEQGQLIPVYQMSLISFQEKFGPLIGFTGTTKGKVSWRIEYAQDRNVGLNLTSSIVAELSNRDLTIGIGFTRANMLIPFKVNGKKVRLPNDLKFNCNLTIRDTRTLTRKLDAETTATQGFYNFQFRPQLSYNVNKKLSLNLYFDRMFNNPLVANQYVRATTQGGIQVRFSLAD